ncbi:MAG TPA: polysaccharide deacetylase family protein [Longimicrobiales bacterium]|nr:polysaccharide deacetylase family protein [Longimicrobiales bacterium]
MKPRWRKAVLLSLLSVAVVFGGLVAAWRLSGSRTLQLFGELVTSVPVSDSVVALTFDDGPVPVYTDTVLALLRREDVHATFFVTGNSVARYPDLARTIIEEGHELGNHSYSHQRMVLMSPSTIRQEVEVTDSLIRAAGATGPIHFRPPYGKRLIVLPWYLSRTDRATVLWSLEPDSWFSRHTDMVRHVVDNVQPGSIILLHVEIPSRAEGREALPMMIRELKQRGYRFATISELRALSRS